MPTTANFGLWICLCGLVISIVLFWFLCAYYSFVFWVFSRLDDRNFNLNTKFIVFVVQLFFFVFEKCRSYKQKTGNWKHKQWFNSAGRSVTSLYHCQFLSMKNVTSSYIKVSLGHMKFSAPDSLHITVMLLAGSNVM